VASVEVVGSFVALKEIIAVEGADHVIA
jgi:hypothetical protein